jgi:hypothetical protein
MSQVKVKVRAARDYRERKKMARDAARAPHPVVTVLVAAGGEILAVGFNRERLALHAQKLGLHHTEMKDFFVVL